MSQHDVTEFSWGCGITLDSHLANKSDIFTIIMRITSSRDKFGPPEMFPKHPVVGLSIPLE